MAASHKRAAGRVVDGRGAALPNVPVSNGETIVLSDKLGRFDLAVDPRRHTHLFVTVPAGWSAPDGFHCNLDLALRQATEFRLTRRRERRHSVHFAAVTDLHYGEVLEGGKGAPRALRRALEKVIQRVPKAQFLLAVGDLTNGGWRPDLQAVQQLFGKLDRPLLPVFGAGHDGRAERKELHTPKPWARHYLETFGPAWYSFDRGSFHFAVFANEDSYFTNPMVAAKQRWLMADLQLASKRGLACIVAVHCPPTMRWARQLERAGVKLILTGHFHSFRTFCLGSMRVVTFPCLTQGGIDMMPPGFLELIARPGHDVRFRYHAIGPAFQRPRAIPKGRQLWSRQISGCFHRAGPVKDGDGRLFLAASDDLGGGGGGIHCIDAMTGRRIWTVPADDAFKNAVALEADRLFAVTQTGSLLCIRQADGHLLWSRRLAQWPDRWVHASPVLGGGVVVAGHGHGGIEAFTTDRGDRAWQVSADQKPFTNSKGDLWPSYSAPAALGNSVVTPFFGRDLRSLAADSGLVQWRFEVRYRYYMPSPLPWRDSVWIPNHQPGDELVRLRVSSGHVLARSAAGGVVVSWSACGNALFLVVLDKWTGGRGWLQRRDAATGRLRWRTAMGRDTAQAYHYCTGNGPNCQAAPVLAHGRLFIACTDGWIRIFDPGTGAPGGRISAGSPLFTAPIIGDRCLWVTTWPGHVMCLAL
ncbi:MAG: PQQ-binding-like beta-propeller repeat protein [Lentisphaeria bacterium]|jgi:hypothetical protein|nr:PQQ-binding-like beta-propeller repeat protein [Lentisphaeria bacterium]